MKPITAIDVLEEQPVRVRAAFLAALERVEKRGLKLPEDATPEQVKGFAATGEVVVLPSEDIECLLKDLKAAGVKLSLGRMGLRLVASDATGASR